MRIYRTNPVLAMIAKNVVGAEIHRSGTLVLAHLRMSRIAFRILMWSAFYLAFWLSNSTYGWGWTHSPDPGLNFGLSFIYFGCLVASGIILAKDARGLGSGLKRGFMIVGSLLAVLAVYFGLHSLVLQRSSVHNQTPHHQVVIGIEFAILTFIVTMKIIEERLREPYC